MLDELDRLATGRGAGRMWVSHEALLLDYEEPFVRRDPHTGQWYLLSTDLPWIGERTRRVGGAHVDFLSQVANPVACEIGPDSLLHRFPGEDGYETRLRWARLRDLVSSRAAATACAESYVGQARLAVTPLPRVRVLPNRRDVTPRPVGNAR